MNEDTKKAHDTGSNTSVQQRDLAGQNPKLRTFMEVLLKDGGKLSTTVKQGDIVEGKVLEKKGTQVFVDLGTRGLGIIFGREYYAASDIIKNLNPGDAISAKVVEPDNEDGCIELSLKEAGEERRWTTLYSLMQKGEALELKVLEANRGGLILETAGVKGFLPASQMSPQNYPRVDGGDKERILQELQKLVGQNLKVRIIDLNPGENKLIFTEKQHNTEEMKQILAQYKIGDEVDGEVVSVVDFGAFVKIAGTEFEGLVHISEIDWGLIEDPRTVLKPGEKIKAKIIDIQGDKISLSIKQLKTDPWSVVSEKYHKGDTIKGKVTKHHTFGSFVQVEKDVHGLIHISEFGTEQLMRDSLKVGQEYQFRVLLVDPKEHKMSLGLVRDEKSENPAS